MTTYSARIFFHGIFIICSVFFVAKTQAATLSLYDPLTTTLSPALWNETERVRAIYDGQLHIAQMSWGETTDNVQATFHNFNQDFANPASLVGIQATVTVADAIVPKCAANTTFSGSSQARVLGTFFNAGIPRMGSHYGDVIAVTQVVRASNSSDATGVFQVKGALVLCSSNDCNESLEILK